MRLCPTKAYTIRPVLFLKVMMDVFKFLAALFCLVTFAWPAKVDGTGQEHCHYPRMVCGEDECLPPGKICNGKVECADNTDEEPGLCKHFGHCHSRCLRDADSPTDRWTSVSCSMCCMADLNGDGFLTSDESDEAYTALCGNDANGGTLEGLATMSSYNNIPLCDGEMADFIKFYSGVVDDVGPDAVSRQDIAATFAESLGAPGDKVPISRCLNFYEKTVRPYVYDESCEISVSSPGPALKFGLP